jgi:hypothetical protein
MDRHKELRRMHNNIYVNEQLSSLWRKQYGDT